MSDRDFWIMVRAALLMFVDAIERRFCLGKHERLTSNGEHGNIK